MRLYEFNCKREYLEPARRLHRDVVRTVALGIRLPAAVGGAKASQLIWGGYLPLAYSNWATKCLLDSLMTELRIVGG